MDQGHPVSRLVKARPSLPQGGHRAREGPQGQVVKGGGGSWVTRPSWHAGRAVWRGARPVLSCPLPPSPQVSWEHKQPQAPQRSLALGQLPPGL